MFPLLMTAASFLPSLEEAMPCHLCALPPGLRSVQVAPESVEVQMFSLLTVAASLVPSLEEAMSYHLFVPWPRRA